MTPSEEATLRAAFPPGTEVVEAVTYRPGYLTFPVRATVRTPAGEVVRAVVKTGEAISLEREATTLRALAEIRLPVPAVLDGPALLPDGTGALLVLSEMPGRPLPWIALTSLPDADRACRLLIQGTARLHRLTEQVRRHPIADTLPRVTLTAELDETRAQAGEWEGVEVFAHALARLPRALAAVEVPLVFSNGDYNPLNFLHEGDALTGWVDFEGACFEDPHIGFAKFLLWSGDDYGWGTGAKAGLVERYLYTQNVSRREFAPRLVLRGLRHLQRETEANDIESAHRRHMLNVVADHLPALEL